MPEHIPGKPTVVASNVPGAGSLLLTNQIYNTQPKDGTVIGLINRGVPFEPLLGGVGTRFDPMRFNYIGSPDRDTPACAVRMDAPINSVPELLTKELIVGATGSGADSQVYRGAERHARPEDEDRAGLSGLARHPARHGAGRGARRLREL